MKKSIIVAAALIFAAAGTVSAQQPVPVDPAVRIGRLDNGLTYYIRHNEEPKGQANFYIAQKVGSILEEEDQRGLAHFLEHMCFNGTEHFPGNGVIRYCESIGVKFGQNLNAYTSIDETVYNIDNVPVAAVPSAVDSCLWILHDWADGLLLTDEDIDHERGVIHEEWRTRSNAQMRMFETILPAIFPDGNRYGHRLPIGLMSVVDNFPYKALRDYYEKWYRPDQQGIIVVGDIDADEIETKIESIFGSVEMPENPAERVSFEVPDNEAPIICLAKDKEQSVAISSIYLKHDPYPWELRSDINYCIYEYALNAATMMLNDRIQEMVQKADAPFIDAQVSDGEFFIARTKYALSGVVASSEANLGTAVTALYRELLRAVRGGFTDSELDRANAKIISSLESAYNSRDKKKSAEYCSEYVRHFIDNEPIAGAEADLAIATQISSIITAEMVGDLLASLVDNDNLVMFSMLPDKADIVYPTEAEMAEMLAAVAAEDIEPYTEEVSDEPLLSELPMKGKVVKSKAAKLGYTKYSLSNGATVYFKQTDFNPDEVLVNAVSKGGASLYAEDELVNLQAVNELASIGGLGNLSRTELKKVLAGRKVSVNPEISSFSEAIRSSSTPKDLETLFQLNYLYFTNIREDGEAFESWRERVRASLVNRESDPTAAFQDSLRTTIYNHPGRVSSLKASKLDGIDYGKVLDMVRERFANAADFTFIITGAVDEATLLPLLEQYVASLPSVGRKEKADLRTLDFASGRRDNVFIRKMEIPMTSNFFFDFSKAKYNLKNKLSFDLALNALSVVLLEEIREKEGGTYGIGAYGEMSGSPAPRQQAYMQIAYQTNPEKYEYLNGRVREIVAEFAENGPSEENLAKGKEFFLKNHNENLRENSYWSEVFENLLDTGTDITENFEAVLESITVEDTRKVVASMLKKGNHSEVIMVGSAD